MEGLLFGTFAVVGAEQPASVLPQLQSSFAGSEQALLAFDVKQCTHRISITRVYQFSVSEMVAYLAMTNS